MSALDLGEPGNCLSCSKARDHVIGESCIDCRIYYGTATLDQVVAHAYALELYQRGFENGLSTAVFESDSAPAAVAGERAGDAPK